MIWKRQGKTKGDDIIGKKHHFHRVHIYHPLDFTPEHGAGNFGHYTV